MRERSALLGLGGLYPPEVRGPAELYHGQPPGPGPHVPTSIARPELSPVTRQPLPPASPLSRSRDMLRGPSPGVPGGKMSQGPPMFSPHSSAPFAPASANNSSLSDKLKLGFSSEARPPVSHPGLPHEAIKREAEPYLRHPLGHSSASASLVTASSHSGETQACCLLSYSLPYCYNLYIYPVTSHKYVLLTKPEADLVIIVILSLLV